MWIETIEEFPGNEWRVMTSGNENAFFFSITGSLWGKSSGYQMIPITEASNVELLFSLLLV